MIGKAFFTTLLGLAIVLASCQEKNTDSPGQSAGEQAPTSYSQAIRPGIPGERPFWNQNARRFMYAPAFGFEEAEGAASYRFTLTADSLTGQAEGTSYTFEAEKPWAALSPVWEKLPVGYLSLKVEALDEKGETVSTVGEREFYRAAQFKGNYREPKMPYRESALKALTYYFGQPMFQNLLKEKSLDPAFGRSAYPSKTLGAIAKIMLMYIDHTDKEENKEKALSIARSAADYLIQISQPEDAPLAYFPPTYLLIPEQEGKLYEYKIAKLRQNQIMMNYPVYVAIRMLDLYDATGEEKYFEYALNIADTYIETANEEGTWPILVDIESLEAIKPNMCIPTRQLLFFERLHEQYGLEKYKEAEEMVLNWLMENPVKDWRWEGQFEDVTPFPPYENMSKTQSCEFAWYLADNAKENESYIPLAEELMRYSEDQFVVWEKPMPMLRPMPGIDTVGNGWLMPCALEQYHYYTAIDHSAASLMVGWLKLYEATGKEIYLQKAEELGKTCTVAQKPDGRYCTYWVTYEMEGHDWLNCAAYMIELMLYLDSLKQAGG